MISNIFSKSLRNKKISKTHHHDHSQHLSLMEKSMKSKGDDEEAAEDDQYREDEVFKTEKVFDEEDVDEEEEIADKKARAESDVETALLETRSKNKSKANAHAELKKDVANNLNKIVLKNKSMLSKGKLMQKRTAHLLSGVKKSLA